MTRIGQKMAASRFGSYSQWVRQMIRSGQKDGNRRMALAESSVPEPLELLRETIAQAFSTSIPSRYASSFADGNPYVLASLAQRLGVPESHLLCTTGATGALSILLRALLTPGDRILVETPCFDLFHTLASTHRIGVDQFTRHANDFTIDPERLRTAMTPDTRLILLSNLHNPSGMMLDRQTLAAIGQVADAHGAMVVIDEVYADYAGADFIAASSDIHPGFIRIGSLTKGWGLSTLRCGWIVAEPRLLAPVRAFSEQAEFGISKLAHAVAALALDDAARFDGRRDDMMRTARPLMQSFHARWLDQGLATGSLSPYGCTTFPKLEGISHSEHFAEWLAETTGVIVVPGVYFGAPGHIRVGFASSRPELEHGLQALTDGLKHYRDLFPEDKEARTA